MSSVHSSIGPAARNCGVSRRVVGVGSVMECTDDIPDARHARNGVRRTRRRATRRERLARCGLRRPSGELPNSGNLSGFTTDVPSPRLASTAVAVAVATGAGDAQGFQTCRRNRAFS